MEARRRRRLDQKDRIRRFLLAMGAAAVVAGMGMHLMAMSPLFARLFGAALGGD